MIDGRWYRPGPDVQPITGVMGCVSASDQSEELLLISSINRSLELYMILFKSMENKKILEVKRSWFVQQEAKIKPLCFET